MEFKSKVFVVTGGGKGIGREVVLQLLQHGASVAALDISETGLQETLKLSQNNENLSTHVVNITDKKLVDTLPEMVIAKHGQVDGVINVAGIIQPFVLVNDLSMEQIERVMNVNFYGTLYMVKAFLPHLLGKPTECYIANVSSMGGFLPVPGQSVYGASKAAVKLLTEGLYAETLGTNVHVSIIFPGAIATNITANSGVHLEMPEGSKTKSFPMLSAPAAATVILKGMQKNKFRILVGKDAKIMNFLYSINPKNAVHMITKQMASLLKK